MPYLDTIFSYYDKIMSGLPVPTQALISLVLLIFLIWQIFMIIKSGHWLFIVLLVIFLPGTWPAVKTLGSLILTLLKFLLARAQLGA